MGPGAPGFARVSSTNSTGKPALAHATRPSRMLQLARFCVCTCDGLLPPHRAG